MIDLTRLPSYSRRVLETAGWHPDRRVSTIHWQEALAKEGYIWFNHAEIVVRELGGLTIHMPPLTEALFGSGKFIVDPECVLGERLVALELERLIGELVVPIGEWDDIEIVYLSFSGQVLSQTTGIVLKLGDRLEDALDVMIRRHRYPQVLKGTVWWQR